MYLYTSFQSWSIIFDQLTYIIFNTQHTYYIWTIFKQFQCKVKKVYICWNKCKRRKCDHQTMSLQKVKSNANLILFYSLEQLISKFVNWKSLPFILIQKSSIVEIANDNKHLSRQLCTCPILLQRKKKKRQAMHFIFHKVWSVTTRTWSSLFKISFASMSSWSESSSG